MTDLRHGRYGDRTAFTLVEILIAVAIIGLLAAIAIPSLRMAREYSRETRFINDLRKLCDAFGEFRLFEDVYPADSTPAIVPAGMDEYLPKLDFTADTSIGGQWDWDYGVFGFLAGVSVYRPGVSPAVMRRIDTRIDDGDLTTGFFRQRAQGFIYILEP